MHNETENTTKVTEQAPPSAVESDYPNGAPKEIEHKEKRVDKLTAYALTTVIGLLVAGLIVYSRVTGDNVTKVTVLGALSDGFWVPAVLYLCLGALLRIGEGGFFDGISFALKNAIAALIPGARLKKPERYADYKERKEKNRTHTRVPAFFVVGLVFLVISILFLSFM